MTSEVSLGTTVISVTLIDAMGLACVQGERHTRACVPSSMTHWKPSLEIFYQKGLPVARKGNMTEDSQGGTDQVLPLDSGGAGHFSGNTVTLLMSPGPCHLPP